MKNIRAFQRWLFVIPVIAFSIVGCSSTINEWLGERPDTYHYLRACERAKTAITDNPQDTEAHFQLGICYSNLDSVSLAFDHFQKSIKIDPDPKRIKLANNNIRHNYKKHYRMGQKAFENKNFEAAAEEYKKATLADPRRWLGFFKLGVTYSQLGIDNRDHYARAKRAFEDAFHKAPDPDKRIVIDAFDQLLATNQP